MPRCILNAAVAPSAARGQAAVGGAEPWPRVQARRPAWVARRAPVSVLMRSLPYRYTPAELVRTYHLAPTIVWTSCGCICSYECSRTVHPPHFVRTHTTYHPNSRWYARLAGLAVCAPRRRGTRVDEAAVDDATVSWARYFKKTTIPTMTTDRTRQVRFRVRSGSIMTHETTETATMYCFWTSTSMRHRRTTRLMKQRIHKNIKRMNERIHDPAAAQRADDV